MDDSLLLDFEKGTITKTIQLFSGQHKHFLQTIPCNLNPSLCNTIKQKDMFLVI